MRKLRLLYFFTEIFASHSSRITLSSFDLTAFINTYLEDLTNQITLYGALGGNENIEEKIEERNF